MSRLIKTNAATSREKKKIISIKKIHDEPEIQSTEDESEKNFSERYAKENAEKIIADANQYAESLKQQVQKEKEEWQKEKNILISEAKAAGFAEGVQEGRKKGYQEIEEQLEMAKNTVKLSKKDYQAKLESSEQTILALGIKVAEKIIAEKMESYPQQFTSLVKQVLKEVREFKEIQLHINPVYYEAVLTEKNELLKIFPREIEFYIYPDHSLPVGSCIIESPHGRIDASIDQQLKEIKEKLYALLESE